MCVCVYFLLLLRVFAFWMLYLSFKSALLFRGVSHSRRADIFGGKLLSSARKLPEADRDPEEESAQRAGDGASHPSPALGSVGFPEVSPMLSFGFSSPPSLLIKCCCCFFLFIYLNLLLWVFSPSCSLIIP